MDYFSVNYPLFLCLMREHSTNNYRTHMIYSFVPASLHAFHSTLTPSLKKGVNWLVKVALKAATPHNCCLYQAFE